VDVVLCVVEICAKVMGLRNELTGNNGELDSRGTTVLQWCWAKGNSMKQALEIDAVMRASGKPTVEEIELTL
jgi:hypothetical protein